jgi:hypothetical protein
MQRNKIILKDCVVWYGHADGSCTSVRPPDNRFWEIWAGLEPSVPYEGAPYEWEYEGQSFTFDRGCLPFEDLSGRKEARRLAILEDLSGKPQGPEANPQGATPRGASPKPQGALPVEDPGAIPVDPDLADLA